MAVRIVEVGPRDGLQNWKANVPTEVKLALIQRLEKTGLRTIELTSIVSPRKIPQLADGCDLLSSKVVQEFLTSSADLRLPVLVPNLKGFDVAQKSGVKEVAVFVSATEGFSKANINCSVQEGLERARSVAHRARSVGIAVRG
jgi:hydroxymethylglutaryl-CoA lyase